MCRGVTLPPRARSGEGKSRSVAVHTTLFLFPNRTRLALCFPAGHDTRTRRHGGNKKMNCVCDVQGDWKNTQARTRFGNSPPWQTAVMGSPFFLSLRRAYNRKRVMNAPLPRGADGGRLRGGDEGETKRRRRRRRPFGLSLLGSLGGVWEGG